MKIGLFMTPQWQPGADLARGCDELVEQARAARDAGFASLLIGQHMVTGPDMQMLQVVPLMARLIPETEGMLIGPGVMLLPMLSPVLVAEEAATLDWLSGGRYVLAAGLGYRPEEFEAMGTTRGDRVPRMEEGLEVIRRLWTEERVTHHGRHFHVSNVGASVRPCRQPHPPIWLGGDVEPAVRRAARLADAWLGSPTTSEARANEQLGWFEHEWLAHRDGSPPPCPVIRECFVGRDAAHAARVSRGPLLYKYKAYASWGHHDLAGRDLDAEFDTLCDERFVVGDAARAAAQIERFAERLKTDHLILRAQWPGLEQSEVLANIRRIGEVAAMLHR